MNVKQIRQFTGKKFLSLVLSASMIAGSFSLPVSAAPTENELKDAATVSANVAVASMAIFFALGFLFLIIADKQPAIN